jgi:small-conductance mechanosensitive channel
MFMHPRKNKIPWLSKLPVLLLYLLFFAVQIFFNYGAVQQVVSPSSQKHRLFKIIHSHIKVISSQQLVKSKIRLNKRFEPSVIPPISVPEIAITVVQVSPKTMGHYQCRYYPEIFLSDHSLRGPPVVA